MKTHALCGAFAGLVLVQLVAPASVRGEKPEVTLERVHLEFAQASCDGFEVLVEADADLRWSTFFDRDGNPARLQAQVYWRGVATNSVTGKAIADRANYVIVFDLKIGTQTYHGVGYHWVIPGEGVVVLDAGTFVVDAGGNVVFMSAEQGHDWITQGGAVLCAALD
jgi:hypothetical protein